MKGIVERDLNIIPEICACPLPGSPSSPRECIEDVSEPGVPEEVIVTGWPVTGRITWAEFGMAHLVVLGFLRRVTEYLVRLIDLLELIFSFLAPLVQVRVKFPRKVTECFLEIIR
jgi:hypothetical protein